VRCALDNEPRLCRRRQRSALHYGIPDRLDPASGPLSGNGGLPFRKQIAVSRSSLFWLFSAANFSEAENCQIRNMNITIVT
jgi:hypothetical protein